MSRTKRLIVAIAALALFAGNALAWEQPKLPPAEKFKLEGTYPCSGSNVVVERFEYWDENDVYWVKWFLKGKTNPLAVIKLDPAGDKYWIDSNSDGKMDEHYSYDEVVAKYPRGPCEIAKKQS